MTENKVIPENSVICNVTTEQQNFQQPLIKSRINLKILHLYVSIILSADVQQLC